MNLFMGEPAAVVMPLLDACLRCHEAAYLHPLVEVCARPFSPALMERVHPHLRDAIYAELVQHAQREPALAPVIRAAAEAHVALGEPAIGLRIALAEHFILCGRLDEALNLLAEVPDAAGLFLRSVVAVVRDDPESGLPGVEAALKGLRLSLIHI